MDTIKVRGKNNRHKVLVYALSTCVWCNLTKKFLVDNNVEHEYINVDQCSDGDKEKIRLDIIEKGGRLSYPVVIIDDKKLINGFQKEDIMEAIGI
jgi:glutaredoxin-like protein NrdH